MRYMRNSLVTHILNGGWYIRNVYDFSSFAIIIREWIRRQESGERRAACCMLKIASQFFGFEWFSFLFILLCVCVFFFCYLSEDAKNINSSVNANATNGILLDLWLGSDSETRITLEPFFVWLAVVFLHLKCSLIDLLSTSLWFIGIPKCRIPSRQTLFIFSPLIMDGFFVYQMCNCSIEFCRSLPIDYMIINLCVYVYLLLTYFKLLT